LTTPVPALPDSYLRAILALPGDDGPRLCAADWWDEQGAAERAEFVRVQCELARRHTARCTYREEPWPYSPPAVCALPNCSACGGGIVGLRQRERELLAGSRGKWFDFPITWYVGIDPVPVGAHGFQYRRGFFEVAALTATDFLTHADALQAACPLRRVRLTTWPGVSREVDVERKVLTFTLLVGPRVVQYRDTMLGVLRYQGDAQQVVVSRLLTAAFPGIDFEMPTVEFRPGGLPPSQLPLTTDNVWDVPRGADPRAVAAPREGTSG
jgi:uncharacterized protein (TIGR02996 family)